MDKGNPRLLTIPRLFSGAKDVFHIAYYHVPRAGYQDRISRSILDFKEGKEPQQSRWISLATSLVGKAIRPDLIVRRLAPEETRAERVTSLDLLCEAAADACECEFDRVRLSKVRATNPLHDLAGRMARQKELQDVYTFDASGLAEDLKILVVDDITITGSTLEAITCAIKRELPEAEVSCFVLGRADGRIPNAHLNPPYFAGENVPAFAQAGAHAPGNTAKDLSVNLADTVRMAVPAGLRPAARRERSRRVRTVLLAALMIVLLVGALAPLRTSKDAMASSDLIPLNEQGINEAPVPVLKSPFKPAETSKPAPAAPARVPAPAAKEHTGGLNAIVTVPGVGLRQEHKINARILHGTSLRKGERVAVLKKFTGGSGPSWVQVRTKTGKTGWLFASLVHVKR